MTAVFRRSGDFGAASARGLLTLVILALIAFSVLLYIFGQVIPPGDIGIRQIAFGPYRGFSERALLPGYHWVIPFYSRIYVIPQTLQVIEFHRAGSGVGSGAGSGGAGLQSLEVPTADRATVSVDLSVLVRYDASGRVLSAGVEPDAWERTIRTSAENALRRSLSELLTSEFYVPERREPKLKAAAETMQSELRDRGIIIEGVLLRRYTYETSIEDSIFNKNLEELKREIREREAEYARAEGAVENVKSEVGGTIIAVKEDGERNAGVMRSEGDLYEAQKKAEGDLLVAKARAEVDSLRASVLAKSEGANVYVARELAPLLGSLKGGMITGLDPYDIDAWMKRLGLKEVK